ncbi:S16 family serine protease [Microbacterium sp.]|uniref:S16 family serine protease n=1 Tax=Microbacterium sp. TaxID=51671 RepID=UPI0039E2E051
MFRIHRALAALALTVSVALVASGCVAATIPEKSTSTSITITWLATRGSEGTTGTTKISRTDPEEAGDFRVEFSVDEVGGIGDQSQAGAWNAAIASTLLLGLPLEGEFRFETDGWNDGPSAGALTTAGLIALARGEKFLKKVTMTGTINSTGMIGPVGGIPEKVAAAGDAGFTTVLIPMGQRNTPDKNGDYVDVVREGDRIGVEVIEVGDIYEAYQHLTGTQIDVPGVTRDPRLDNTSYDKIKPQTDAALARYTAARASLERLPAAVQEVFAATGLIALADGYAAQATDLQRQGLQAGAYNLAAQAAAAMEAIAAVGSLLLPLTTQGLAGLDTFFAQAMDTTTASLEFGAFLDRLSAYEPKNVSDVEGLVNGYAGAFDAYSLLMFAENRIADIQARFAAGDFASLDEMFSELTAPALWAQLARSQISNAAATFEVGRDNPGAKISDEVDLQQVGDFFRRGADANYAAFESVTIAPLAEQYGVSADRMTQMLANVDLNVAFAVSQANVQPAIADYIGPGKPNAQYATLGYGLNNFARNQGLVDKYYNNAVLGENLVVVDVQFDAVLSRSLELGRQQLAAEVELLRANDTEPVVSVASYEVAGLLRSGTLDEQFTAIGLYNGGFLTTRMMAYLAELGRGSSAD